MTLCLVAAMMAWARPITKEQAISQARQFVEQRRLLSAGNIVLNDAPRQSIHRAPSSVRPEDACSQQDVSNSHDQAYYVFNVGSGDGFVIVSADDSTMPILGYCDHGSFDDANTNFFRPRRGLYKPRRGLYKPCRSLYRPRRGLNLNQTDEHSAFATVKELAGSPAEIFSEDG